MARQQMVQVRCDRCKRVEYVPVDSNKDVEAKFVLAFQPSGGGKQVNLEFKDLCSPCEKTVSKLIEGIARDIKGKSPKRSAAKKTEGEDPSVSVTTVEDKPTQRSQRPQRA